MSWFTDVVRFHHKVSAPIGTGFDTKTLKRRRKLINEEYNEVMRAIHNLLPIRGRGRWGGVTFWSGQATELQQELCAELVDLIYVTVGSFVELGIDPQPVWAAIHAANMQKEAAPDFGGKAVKPDGWQKPKVVLRSFEGVVRLIVGSSPSRAATPLLAVGPAEKLDDAIGKLSERSRQQGFRVGTDTTPPQSGSHDETKRKRGYDYTGTGRYDC